MLAFSAESDISFLDVLCVCVQNTTKKLSAQKIKSWRTCCTRRENNCTAGATRINYIFKTRLLNGQILPFDDCLRIQT